MSENGISRRQFLTGAAVTAAATAVPMVANVSTAAAAGVPSAVQTLGTPPIAGWVDLDAKALAREAYDIYKGKYTAAPRSQSACCEATWWPIIGALAAREAPGSENFAKIPYGMMNYGGGGINTWRSICGCSNAGANVLNRVTGNGNLIDHYLRWYETTALPTGALYADYLAQTPAWTPHVVPAAATPASAAHSVLCHASLTNWRVAGGTWEATHPGAQSDRCGKLCYDAVFKLATMINAWAVGNAGLFSAATDPAKATCGEGGVIGCHGGGTGTRPAGSGALAQAKMECAACHE